MTGLMEATQMMVDIDGDVLVFLELAQVSWQGTESTTVSTLGNGWGAGRVVGRKGTCCQTWAPHPVDPI